MIQPIPTFFNAPLPDVLKAGCVYFTGLKTAGKRKTLKPKPFTIIFAFEHPKTGDIVVSRSRKYFEHFTSAYAYFKKASANMDPAGIVLLVHNRDRRVSQATRGTKIRSKKDKW